MERVTRRVPRNEIYARTGIQFQRFNTLYQMAATAQDEPAWMAEAAHALLIPDYLHYRLSDVVSNEYTNATTTQMLNVDGQWDSSLLDAARVPARLFQPTVAAGTVLGPLTGASHVGAHALQVIAPATHDTASAVAAAPLRGEDEAYISSGTWSLMGFESRTPYLSEAAREHNFTNEGGIEGRFRVLKNIMGLWPLQRMRDESCSSGIEQLVSDARSVPAWQSIVNLDDAVFLNPPSMIEAVQAYCARTGQLVPQTDAELARTVFDSLALSYRKTQLEIEQLRGRALTRIRIIGGGCQNDLLNQLTANACQLPVSAGPVEASALGNVCVQMIALGVLKDVEHARELICTSFPVRHFEPQTALPAAVWRQFLDLQTFHFESTESETLTR